VLRFLKALESASQRNLKENNRSKIVTWWVCDFCVSFLLFFEFFSSALSPPLGGVRMLAAHVTAQKPGEQHETECSDLETNSDAEKDQSEYVGAV